MDRDRWASDGPVSAPKPNDRITDVVTVDLGGMVFTPVGIALPVTTALHEERYSPAWGPRRDEDDRGRSA